VEFKDIAQEVRVWAAMNDFSSDAYNELWDALDYLTKPVDLPGGQVRKVAEGKTEDDKRFIVFQRVTDQRLYRLDSSEYSSWSDETFYPPYEVVAKEVTEIRYTKV
jgi:hypothetical protein